MTTRTLVLRSRGNTRRSKSFDRGLYVDIVLPVYRFDSVFKNTTGSSSNIGQSPFSVYDYWTADITRYYQKSATTMSASHRQREYSPVVQGVLLHEIRVPVIASTHIPLVAATPVERSERQQDAVTSNTDLLLYTQSGRGIHAGTGTDTLITATTASASGAATAFIHQGGTLSSPAARSRKAPPAVACSSHSCKRTGKTVFLCAVVLVLAVAVMVVTTSNGAPSSSSSSSNGVNATRTGDTCVFPFALGVLKAGAVIQTGSSFAGATTKFLSNTVTECNSMEVPLSNRGVGLWHQIAVAEDERVSLNVCTTANDANNNEGTVLAVTTGSDCNTCVPVVQEFNSCGAHRTVSFPASTNTLYSILVYEPGLDTTGANYVLTISSTTAPTTRMPVTRPSQRPSIVPSMLPMPP